VKDEQFDPAYIPQ